MGRFYKAKKEWLMPSFGFTSNGQSIEIPHETSLSVDNYSAASFDQVNEINSQQHALERPMKWAGRGECSTKFNPAGKWF